MSDFHTLLKSAIQARRRGRPLLLLLDYDGTLVEIAPLPELARPTSKLLEVLDRLVDQSDLKALVVSGRSLRDLQELLPMPGLDFLGSHGGEAFISGFLHPLQIDAIDINELLHWQSRLEARLQPFSGWLIEDKPFGFALHYRQVPAEQVHEFLAIIERWQEQLRLEKRFQLLRGKKVLEILPQGVSKGRAIKEILSLPTFLGYFPIYLGDDITDESAFNILQSQGLTIKVGHPGTKTAASCFLPDPAAVRHFLSQLASSLENL